MTGTPYEYNVRDRSLLAPIYKRLLWEPLVAAMPPRVPANALTLAANACGLGAVAVLLAAPSGSRPAMAFAALGVFAYFTLDSIDGPHARKTGAASALGELLDHWLDVWELGLLAVGMTAFFGCPAETRLLVLTACSLGMFAVFWEHYHTGRFPVGPVGANEVLTAITLLLAAGALFGIGPLVHPVVAGLSVVSLFWILVAGGFAWVFAQTAWRHRGATHGMAAVAAQELFLAAWFLAAGSAWPWVLAALLSAHGLFCGRVIVCRLRKTRFVAHSALATVGISGGALLGLAAAPEAVQTAAAQGLTAGMLLLAIGEFAALARTCGKGRDRASPACRLFTPGPVPMSPSILRIGARQLPYNRTEAFSQLTHELIDGLRQLFGTQGQVALLTSSGTGAMEAAVQNLLGERDRALVINGGTFGQRWADLCARHDVPFEELPVPAGRSVLPNAVEQRLSTGRYTALLMTAHETSTGVRNDVARLGAAARRQGVLAVVDAISAIGADPFDMDRWQIDATVLSSHKALAIPPGLAFVALGESACRRLEESRPRSLYFDLRDSLANQQRGQTPYTPAIGLFLMLHARLRQISARGRERLVADHARRARYFRARLAGLPVRVFPDRPSNALTALECPPHIDAGAVVRALAERHGLMVAPSGGELRRRLLRVGHLGRQTREDLDVLVAALGEVLAQQNRCHRKAA